MLGRQSTSEHDVIGTSTKAGVSHALDWLAFAETARTSNNATVRSSTCKHRLLLSVTRYAAVALWSERLTTDQKVSSSCESTWAHIMINVVASGTDRGLLCVPGRAAYFHTAGPWRSVGARPFRDGPCRPVLIGADPCRRVWIMK